jgi:hypothetical protein
MHDRGVDYMRSKTFTAAQRQHWQSKFDQEYAKSHGKALYDENRYVAAKIEELTGHSITPEIVAAADPTSDESRREMTLPTANVHRPPRRCVVISSGTRRSLPRRR